MASGILREICAEDKYANNQQRTSPQNGKIGFGNHHDMRFDWRDFTAHWDEGRGESTSAVEPEIARNHSAEREIRSSALSCSELQCENEDEMPTRSSIDIVQSDWRWRASACLSQNRAVGSASHDCGAGSVFAIFGSNLCGRVSNGDIHQVWRRRMSLRREFMSKT